MGSFLFSTSGWATFFLDAHLPSLSLISYSGRKGCDQAGDLGIPAWKGKCLGILFHLPSCPFVIIPKGKALGHFWEGRALLSRLLLTLPHLEAGGKKGRLILHTLSLRRAVVGEFLLGAGKGSLSHTDHIHPCIPHAHSCITLFSLSLFPF